ncbi:MAG: hypothetical protein M1815_005109 [Lichina confinis]|nr:MAG: hypothetical protein M1815_005109 [Lichina confinis]
MKPPLPALPRLKLAQLKYIAVQCGINSAGTKPVLAQRIEEEVGTAQTSRDGPGRRGAEAGDGEPPSTTTKRILSIDMGIRNLAYCVLDVPGEKDASATKRRRGSAPSVQAGGGLSLRAWKRIAVAPSLSTMATDGSTVAAKESFEPCVYASYAYKFLADTLRTHSPTHVLIERQRYRSMGSSAILEWTVRVNMFEGMLYAVLRTLREERRWSGVVQAVSPLKVVAFWLDHAPSARDMLSTEGQCRTQTSVTSNKNTGKNANKAAKISLVAQWLQTSSLSSSSPVSKTPSASPKKAVQREGVQVLHLTSASANHTATAFMDRYLGTKTPTPTRRRGNDPKGTKAKKSTKVSLKTEEAVSKDAESVLAERHTEDDDRHAKGERDAECKAQEEEEEEADHDQSHVPLKKLDDLADCLLQGVAYVRWELNKTRYLRGEDI